MDDPATLSLPSDLLEVDWELLGTHSATSPRLYHWYPQQERREVAGVLIGCLSEKGGRVLDPFCGIGTILVEAQRQHRLPIGGDINPAASLVTNARLLGTDVAQWSSYVDLLRTGITHHLVSDSFTTKAQELFVSNNDENRRWYHQNTLNELTALWTAIHNTPGPYTLIAEASFSAILRKASSQRGPINRIADNVLPASLKYHPAIGPFFSQLDVYFQNRQKRHTSYRQPDRIAWTGTSRLSLVSLPSMYVDLALTRVPEPGAVDYVRSHRLTSLWFGWEVEDYAASEIGARYKRRQIKALTEYFAGMDEIFHEVARIIKPHGWCALILGPTICRKGIADELCQMLTCRKLTTVARLRHRRRERHGGPRHEQPREEIIIARRED